MKSRNVTPPASRTRSRSVEDMACRDCAGPVLRAGRLGGRGRLADGIQANDLVATKEEATRVLAHDLVLEAHQAIEKSLGTRWTPGDVDVDGNDPVDALEGRVARERSAD